MVGVQEERELVGSEEDLKESKACVSGFGVVVEVEVEVSERRSRRRKKGFVLAIDGGELGLRRVSWSD